MYTTIVHLSYKVLGVQMCSANSHVYLYFGVYVSVCTYHLFVHFHFSAQVYYFSFGVFKCEFYHWVKGLYVLSEFG